jgi:hypothetical protein
LQILSPATVHDSTGVAILRRRKRKDLVMKLMLKMFLLTNLAVAGLALTGCDRDDTATPVTPAAPVNPTTPQVDTATPRTATEQVTPPADTALPSTLPSTMPAPQ